MEARRPLIAFRDAFRGVAWMLREEPHTRFHVVAALGVVIGGAAFRVPLESWAALIFAITLVILAETLNTAVEAVLDLVKPERHPLVRVVKDLAAGAVLVAATGATVIALLVFVPEVVALVS